MLEARCAASERASDAASGAHVQPAMSGDLKSQVKLVMFVYKESMCLRRIAGVAGAVP